MRRPDFRATRGFFVTFEGGEGAGKGSGMAAVRALLESRGIEALYTREPGGTPGGQAIRKLLVEEGADWEPLAELLLLFADRAQHLRRTIEPALAKGGVVVCDRFVGSTIAYQGAGRGLSEALVRKLQRVAAGVRTPDLTLLLDVPPEVGLGRSLRRLKADGSRETAFESLDLAFHQRVQASFKAQAASDPARWVVIDATLPLEVVQAKVIEIFEKRLSRLLPGTADRSQT